MAGNRYIEANIQGGVMRSRALAIALLLINTFLMFFGLQTAVHAAVQTVRLTVPGCV